MLAFASASASVVCVSSLLLWGTSLDVMTMSELGAPSAIAGWLAAPLARAGRLLSTLGR